MNFDKHRVVVDVIWLAVIVIRISHIKIEINIQISSDNC